MVSLLKLIIVWEIVCSYPISKPGGLMQVCANICETRGGTGGQVPPGISQVPIDFFRNTGMDHPGDAIGLIAS